jgi:hypothetical protein
MEIETLDYINKGLRTKKCQADEKCAEIHLTTWQEHTHSTHRQVTSRNHSHVLRTKLATIFIYLIYQGEQLEHFERRLH